MPNLKKGHKGRYVVMHESLDKWLEKQAKRKGLRSMQEYLVLLASDAREAEQKQNDRRAA